MTEVQATAGTDITPLLRPLQVGQLELKNRFVMPGMQRAWCVDGAPDERLREYYRRRALGGTALVVCEACAVDHPSAASNPMFARLDARTTGRLARLRRGGARGRRPHLHPAVAPGGGGHREGGPGLHRAQPVGPGEGGQVVRPASQRRRAGGDYRRVRPLRGHRQGHRRRRRRGPRLPRLPARPVPVGGDQPAHRPVRRREHRRTGRRSPPRWSRRSAPRSAPVTRSPSGSRSGRKRTTRPRSWRAPRSSAELVAILRSAGTDLFHVSTRRFWTPEWPGSDLGLAGWVKSFTDAPGDRRRQRRPRHRRHGHADRRGGQADRGRAGSATWCGASSAATSTSSRSAAA